MTHHTITAAFALMLAACACRRRSKTAPIRNLPVNRQQGECLW
jgi:hypothetical protein